MGPAAAVAHGTLTGRVCLGLIAAPLSCGAMLRLAR